MAGALAIGKRLASPPGATDRSSRHFRGKRAVPGPYQTLMLGVSLSLMTEAGMLVRVRAWLIPLEHTSSVCDEGRRAIERREVEA